MNSKNCVQGELRVSIQTLVFDSPFTLATTDGKSRTHVASCAHKATYISVQIKCFVWRNKSTHNSVLLT